MKTRLHVLLFFVIVANIEQIRKRIPVEAVKIINPTKKKATPLKVVTSPEKPAPKPMMKYKINSATSAIKDTKNTIIPTPKLMATPFFTQPIINLCVICQSD